MRKFKRFSGNTSLPNTTQKYTFLPAERELAITNVQKEVNNVPLTGYEDVVQAKAYVEENQK